RRTNEVCFSVADSGIGISTADLPHLFDRFTTASKNAGHGHGTGLGLSIAKGIVEAHQGRIWAESQAGIGSTFYFILPFGRWESEAPSPSASRDTGSQLDGKGYKPVPQNSSRRLVLVVDDDNDCRDILAKMLTGEG